jgi:hypothetical protein
MIYQTDKRLGRYMNKYACLFTSIAFARPYLGGAEWGAEELREKWDTAIVRGYLSGDLNLDGDMDDPGELEIQNHDAVCDLLGAPMFNIPGHHNPAVIIEPDMYAIGRFFNPRTEFKHFAVINREKKVIFDPIFGGSVTCREGYLLDMRLYSIKR